MKISLKKPLSIFLSLFLSFTAIVFIPTSAIIATSIASQHLINEKATSIKHGQLSQICDNFSIAYKKAYLLAFSVTTSPDIVKYTKDTKRNYYLEYEIRIFLEELVQKEEYIKYAYIYFPEYDYIIYDKGAANSSSFVRQYLPTIPYSDWENIMMSSNNRISNQVYNSSTENSSTTLISKSFSSLPIGSSPVFTAVIDNQKILNNSIYHNLLLNDEIIVFNHEIPVASTYLFDGVSFSTFNAKSSINTQNNSYSVSEEGLKHYGLHFFYLSHNINNQIIFLQSFSIILVIIALIVSLWLGHRLSRKHSTKIQTIIDLLKDTSKQFSTKKNIHSDYKEISMLVTQHVENFTSMSSAIHQHKTMLMEQYFIKLLCEPSPNTSIILATTQLYGYYLDYSTHHLLIYNRILSRVEVSDMKSPITQLLSSLSSSVSSYLCIVEDDIIVIISSDNNPLDELESLLLETNLFSPLISQMFTSIDIISRIYADLIHKKNMLLESHNSSKIIENDWVLLAQEIIKLEYNNPNLSTSSIANTLGISRPYLSKYYKDTTSNGLLDDIRAYRINKSYSLLQENQNILVSQVAELTGFNSPESFIRNFKKIHGTTPGRMQSDAHQ